MEYKHKMSSKEKDGKKKKIKNPLLENFIIFLYEARNRSYKNPRFAVGHGHIENDSTNSSKHIHQIIA